MTKKEWEEFEKEQDFILYNEILPYWSEETQKEFLKKYNMNDCKSLILNHKKHNSIK